MKNTIMYYYNFDNISIFRWKDRKIIKVKNEVYLFEKIYNEKEIIDVYHLLNKNHQYYSFVFNRNHQLFTPYNGNYYVLLKKNNHVINLESAIFKIQYVVEGKNISNHKDWAFLWQQKNDYFEYQMNHIYGKFLLIDESIDYFIGMAEAAIAYVSYNDITLQPGIERLALCHKRINQDDFLNPINVVVDYPERDIAEYLKYIFIQQDYSSSKLERIFNQVQCTVRGYYRIYGRLLYPSYYFDLYEQIIDGKVEENKIKKIIDRIDEYEQYLSMIYYIIEKRVDIKEIDWL